MQQLRRKHRASRIPGVVVPKVRTFRFKEERTQIAISLGYDSIQEALIAEYHKLKSARKVGALFGMTGNGVRFAIKAFGEKTNGPGGYRVGDIRRGRPRKGTNQ
jgi:hypothetical protein